jgi:hypothetical protein
MHAYVFYNFSFKTLVSLHAWCFGAWDEDAVLLLAFIPTS